MSLVEHARKELALAGNDEAFNRSIIKSIEAFAEYGHSGGSASVAIPILNELLQYHNLTPLTDSPYEWMDVGANMWQSTRRPDAFSTDGGKTYYLLENRNVIHPTEKARSANG